MTIFYKYRSLRTEQEWKFVEDIITGRKLFMPRMQELNDPFEARVAVCGSASPAQLSGAYRAFEVTRDTVCVLSLSLTCTDPLMWSHYASGHTGVCLGFDSERCKWMSEVYPVRYSDEVPEVTFGVYDGLIDALVLTKARCWAYEQEYRFAQRPSDYGITDRSTPLTVWVEDALVEVVVGMRMSQTSLVRLQDLVARGSPSSSVKFAWPRDHRYELQVLKQRPLSAQMVQMWTNHPL